MNSEGQVSLMQELQIKNNLSDSKSKLSKTVTKAPALERKHKYLQTIKKSCQLKNIADNIALNSYRKSIVCRVLQCAYRNHIGSRPEK